MLFVILIIAAFMLLVIYLTHKRPPKFPPGPFIWPLFGNLLQVCLEMEPHKSVVKLRKKYGDIIGIDLGYCRTVFINEYKLLKEAYNIPAFSGRCKLPHFADPDTGLYQGVVFTSGQKWIDQRRFTFSYIQSGLRNSTENLVTKQISVLIEDIKKTNGRPIETDHLFNIATVNALWMILAGKEYSFNDPDFKKLVKNVTTVLTSTSAHFLAFYPGLSKMFPRLSGFQMIRDNLKPIRQFMQNIVDDHKKTYKDGIQRDFVDAYLKKISITTDQNSSFYGKAGENSLVFTLRDLFLSGTETVSSTLRWLVFLLAHFPEVQKKLIRHIKQQTEHGHSLLLEDRASLPYIEAVILEVLRFSSLTPLGMFHEMTEDVEFHGYIIPKGTVVIANQDAILHDPEIWGDPENFRPERFLCENETEIIRHGALVPFGIGRRVCPGESFARDELFLFTINLFRNFQVEFDPSVPTPPLKYQIGCVTTPVNHRVVFKDIIN